MGGIASQITSLTVAFSTVYSDGDQRKHQSSALLAICAGNAPGTGEFPAQMASNAENASIWWRHHVFRNGVAIIILILILLPLTSITLSKQWCIFKIFITQLIIWHMMYTQMLNLGREITNISYVPSVTNTCSGHWVLQIAIPSLSCPLNWVELDTQVWPYWLSFMAGQYIDFKKAPGVLYHKQIDCLFNC